MRMAGMNYAPMREKNVNGTERVALMECAGISVSTVFLPHIGLYETMTFGGIYDGIVARTTTHELAISLHTKLVALINEYEGWTSNGRNDLSGTGENADASAEAAILSRQDRRNTRST